MSVMQAIQEKFQRFYLEQRRAIASIVMAKEDYDELKEEVLANTDCVGFFHLAKICNQTDGSLVEVLHNPTLERGTFILSEAK